MSYATRTDVEAIYGANNVERWADIDNDGDEDHIEARITWALGVAEDKLNNRLKSSGKYDIPFDEPVDSELTEMTARFAGVLLYESRGLTDTENDDGRNVLTGHRKQVDQFVKDVNSGKVRLTGYKGNSGVGPKVLDSADWDVPIVPPTDAE